MTITFITGASKGLGHETARRLIEQGQTVLVGARDPQRGRQAAEQLGARFVQIDVSDDGSVARAADDVAAREGQIDTLINNAGIVGTHNPPAELTAADAELVYQTNVFSIVRVTHAFPPLLRQAEHPAVVNVTSGHQTITEGTDAIVALATEDPSPGAGRYLDRNGPAVW